MRKLKASEVYARAAQKIEREEEEYSCVAIARVVTPRGILDNHRYLKSKRLRDAYVALFMDGSSNDHRFQNEIETGPLTEFRNLRVMLLCMMAAVTGYRQRRP